MKTKLISSTLAGALALIIGATPASAAVITSISASAPLEERSLVRVDVPSEEQGISYMMRYYNNYSSAANRHREIGQSFVIPGTEPVAIDGIVLRINDNRALTNVAKDFTLTIYKAATDGVPVGDPVYQSTGLLPDNLTDQHYITFLLDSETVLDDGGRYAFQLGFTSSSGASQLSFAAASGNVYSDGRSFYYSNSSSADPSSMIYTTAQRDIDFTILYTPTPVPEGSTAALMVIAAGAVGAYRLTVSKKATALSGEAK